MDVTDARYAARFDVTQRPDCFSATQPNLVVTELELFEGQMKARLCHAGLPNMCNWGNNMHLKQITPTDQRLLFPCPCNLRDELMKYQHVLLFDVEFVPKVGDSDSRWLQVGLKPSTIFVPWDDTQFDEKWMMDLCCGGYGGWTRGMRHIGDYAEVPTHTLGIDNDLASSVFHAVNHDTIWYPDADMTPFFLKNLDRSITIYNSIDANHWKQAAALLRPSIWCFSFPCPSWSSAGYGKGFDAEAGKVFLQGMMWARICKPRYILLENVQGFCDNPQFLLALHVIAFSGFRVVFQTVVDAQDRLPTRRPRWVAILQHMSIPRENFQWESWLANFQSPATWGAVLPVDHEMLTPLWLTNALIETYLDPQLFPPAMRHQAARNPKKCLAAPLDHKPSTFMAAYGSQHMLPPPLIRSKGIMGQLVNQQNRMRFWTPLEVAILHCQTQPIAIPKPAPLGWRHLGNCLVPHHAILTIYNMLRAQKAIEVPLEELLVRFESKRLTVTDHITEDEFAWYLGSQQTTAELQDQVHAFAAAMGFEGHENPIIPRDHYWHPDLGRCDIDHATQVEPTIPATVPFQACEEEVAPTKIDSQGTDCIRAFLEADQDQMVIDHSDTMLPSHHICTVRIQVIFLPGIVYSIHVHPNVVWGDLLALWNWVFYPCPDFSADDMTKLVKPATLQQFDVPSPEHWQTNTMILLLRSMQQFELCVLPFRRGGNWTELCQQFPSLMPDAFDHLGYLGDTPMMRDLQCMGEPSGHLDMAPFQDLSQHMARVAVRTHVGGPNDAVDFLLDGQTDDITPVLMAWTLVCTDEWLLTHGRVLQQHVINPRCILLCFVPDGSSIPTPSRIFREAVAFRLLQTSLSALHTEALAMKVICKFEGRIVKTLLLSPRMSIQAIHNIVAMFISIMHPHMQFRLHSKDRLLAVDDTCNDMGGGPGNRTEHRQTVLAALASLCVGAGVKLDDVASTVQKVQKAVPFSELTALTLAESPDKQTTMLKAIFDTCGIQPTRHSVDMTKVQKKYQKIAQNKQSMAAKHIDTSQYQLTPGFFLLSNGEPAPVHATYSPFQPGITMITASEASKWKDQDSLTPDESAIFIVGELPPTEQAKCQKVTAPATNVNGARVLIAGWLRQLGEKAVVVETNDDHMQEIRDVQICSFTLWKSDFPEDQWTQCTASPVRFAKQLLEKDQLATAIRQPWGRTFRNETAPCANHMATSVQFHAQVHIQDLRRLLRRAGWTGLFITPKSKTGQPSDKWKPIWLDLPKEVMEARAAALPAVAGYIRGKKSHGIRVEIASFGTIWAKLKPDTPPPSFHTGRSFKVSPLPFGVDQAVLSEWLSQVGWKATPVRSIGAKTWIVNAEDGPPSGMLKFNNDPLLITMIKARSPEEPIGIVAGATASHLEAHDRRLDQLEQTMAKMQETQQQASSATEQRFHNLESNLQNFQREAQTAFQSLRTDFETTVTKAISRQDDKLQASMQEIKQLLLRKDKRKGGAEADDDSM
eukprot:Skav228635  [mRNA]  locus=scaffold204:45914:50575:+ [translate_table: standard]